MSKDIKKDVLDEILTQHGKNSIMLKELFENGLSRPELLKILFDQSEMLRVKAEIYKSHYGAYRKELVKQIGFLTSIIDNPAPDWMDDLMPDDYPWTLNKLWALRKIYMKKDDELYPEKLTPKGLTGKEITARKVVKIYDLILPVVDSINKEAGQKRHNIKDIYKLIACLWNYTYGAYEENLTEEKIKNLYFYRT